MSLRIQNDHARFKDIVRGKIKNNLKGYIKKGELIGKQGKDKITIPVPRIDLPHFRYGDKSQGGVGQGEGQPGDPSGGRAREEMPPPDRWPRRAVLATPTVRDAGSHAPSTRRRATGPRRHEPTHGGPAGAAPAC